MTTTCNCYPQLRAAMSKVIAERDRLRAALVGVIGESSREGLEAMEIAMRVMPAPAEDKAVSIDAIHALLATMPQSVDAVGLSVE